MKRFSSADEYIANHPEWENGLQKLRSLLIAAGLEETIKWGAPVYTVNGKNVVGLGAFKPYIGLWFFQGALLKDEKGKLVNAQEGKTRAMRQWRFASGDEMEEELILEYVAEAIQNQKDGKEIKPQKKPLVIPEELRQHFSENKELETAFNKFTLSKKREFAEHIAEAKRMETKMKRLEKIIPMIMDGIGLHDKYRKC